MQKRAASSSGKPGGLLWLLKWLVLLALAVLLVLVVIYPQTGSAQRTVSDADGARGRMIPTSIASRAQPVPFNAASATA